jgi:hypothetical protein
MTQSIEQIWQKGFLDNNSLVAPKINDLYNKKSQNIIDKLKRMFVINIHAITVGAVIILAALTYQGAPILGGFLFVLFILLVVIGKKQLKILEKLDKNVSSYHYIKAFDTWLKEVMTQYIKIYTYLYPAAFIAVMIRLRISEDGERVINGLVNSFPNHFLIAGTPWFVLITLSVVTGLLAYFAGPIYRADMYTAYGRSVNKLGEIIADMEELRK